MITTPEPPADAARAVSELLPRFALDPTLHLHKLDMVRGATLVVAMDAQKYRDESFLDDRILERVKAGVWMPTASLMGKVDAPTRAPHFIFHQGHTGSTLISRLLDSLGAFGVREPGVLNELAALHDRLGEPDALVSRDGWERLARFMLHVWARTFQESAPAVVKATSHAGRNGFEMLAMAPQSRAIVLSMKAEAYLAVLLAGANSATDLRGFAQERMRRLARLFGDVSAPLFALSHGELAAMTWLIERASAMRYLGDAALAPRALDVDFDAFLAAPHEHLKRIGAHLGLDASDARVDAALRGPIMSRYSKDPTQPYTIQQRRFTMDRSRAANAEELRKGLAWLERVSGLSAQAARIID